MSLRFFPAPARKVKSNYVCQFDEAICTQCGKCAKRCAVGALKIKDEKIRFKADYCIGCGLCVVTCPVEALKLMKKHEGSLYTPPLTMLDTFHLMAKEKFG